MVSLEIEIRRQRFEAAMTGDIGGMRALDALMPESKRVLPVQSGWAKVHESVREMRAAVARLP